MERMENAFRQQVNELLKRDPVLQRISAGFFVSSISTKNTHFHNFCKLIVCQQISGKAGDTIFHRLCKYLRVEQIKPANLSNESIESLKKLGVSTFKARYLLRNAVYLCNNPHFFDNIEELDDVEAKTELNSMYGVGDWTASLMLMNSFERSNIFPNKDATLRSAVQKLYGFDILEETERFENISDIWSPHKSLVARMLWFASDNKLI